MNKAGPKPCMHPIIIRFFTTFVRVHLKYRSRATANYWLDITYFIKRVGGRHNNLDGLYLNCKPSLRYVTFASWIAVGRYCLLGLALNLMPGAYLFICYFYRTLRLDEVDRCVVGKKKKQRIRNLRTVCNKILDFCDRQDADDIFYEQVIPRYLGLILEVLICRYLPAKYRFLSILCRYFPKAKVAITVIFCTFADGSRRPRASSAQDRITSKENKSD